MRFYEFKRKMSLLSKKEKEYLYKLTLIEAVDYLKAI